MSWKDLIRLIAPIIIKAKVPHGEVLAPLIVTGIEQAEELKDAKGTDKLKYVRDLTITGAKAINAGLGKEKLNIDAIDNTIDEGISSVITGANIVKTVKKEGTDLKNAASKIVNK